MIPRLARLTLPIVALLVIEGCGPPQLGMDDGAFRAVDALYTAVSIRDPAQLDRCDQKLRDLHASGQVADAAYRSLEGAIVQAREGHWEPAGDDLRWFMKGQRKP